MKPEELAQNLLEKVRNEDSAQNELKKIEDIGFKTLHDSVKDQDSRKAFFLNYYSAEAQRLNKKHPILHKLKLLYILPFLKIAGERISLNTIRNGVLRSSKRKINLRNRRFVRIMHLENADPRIHFALNCGSESCPPIRFYTEEKIDNQLDTATEVYLNQEVNIENNKVFIPRMFKWFGSDFGNIEEFISKYVDLPENPDFEYKSFDWSLNTHNFVEK